MSVFNFKHFSIQQQNSALKVGTDAMVLGSLCNWENPKRLLDIGTGTGVLALMCAQRFDFEEIIGLEIEENAANEAKLNANNSPFQSPIHILNTSLQDLQSEHLFDAIISNPPYFENSFKNEDEQLRLARHTDSLSFDELLSGISRLLADDGRAWIIVPEISEASISEASKVIHLFTNQLIHVFGKPGKHVRTVFCLSKRENQPETRNFTIRTENGDYSDEYKELTKEFHDREL